MALANDPALLIADEPTTALDVTIQAQILDLLAAQKAKRGLALLLISHDLGVVRRYADRVCVMKGGRIVEQGPAAAVFAAPQHPYTQDADRVRTVRPPRPAAAERAGADGGGRASAWRSAGRTRLLRPGAPRGGGGGWRLGRDPGRRDGRAGGGERVRQVHHGPGAAAPGPGGGPGGVRRARTCSRCRRRRCASAGPGCRSCSRTRMAACRRA